MYIEVFSLCKQIYSTYIEICKMCRMHMRSIYVIYSMYIYYVLRLYDKYYVNIINSMYMQNSISIHNI